MFLYVYAFLAKAKRVKLGLRQHCHLPSCRNDTFTLRIMSLQGYSRCNRSKRKNECARERVYSREERGKGRGGRGGGEESSYGCMGAYGKTEERRKKNSRKRSGALVEQKGTKLISEALTNYFLRKGVGYLQLSTRPPTPFSPSLYLFACEAANPPPPPPLSTPVVR